MIHTINGILRFLFSFLFLVWSITLEELMSLSIKIVHDCIMEPDLRYYELYLGDRPVFSGKNQFVTELIASVSIA